MMIKYFNFISILGWLFLLLFTVSSVQGQCPRGIVNCHGGCGRHVDNDGDGFCDLSLKIIPDTVEKTDTIKKQNLRTHNTTNPTKTQKDEVATIQTRKDKFLKTHKIPFRKREIAQSSVSVVQDAKKPRYALLFYSFLTIGAYIFSLLLQKFSVFSKRIHRKIWNTLLLITFILSGMLGLILVAQINYGILPDYFMRFLKWHVEFGIGMALIAIFHVFWHLKYFKNLFKISSATTQKK